MQITRGRLVGVGAVLATVALGVALLVLEPWTLVVDEQVSEALPVAAAPAPSPAPTSDATSASGPVPSAVPSAGPSGPPAGPDPGSPPVSPPVSSPVAPPGGPVELARGQLVSHEHTTTGTARVLRLEDGRRVLRLEGLDTSNGPDLHVWLSDAPVLEGRAGWFVFDDGTSVDLGELRGNQGDANYEIPADVDLQELTSVSIWCERFAVSFGAAALS